MHAIAEPTLFATLPCGARLVVRGLTAGDVPCLIAGLARLSPATRRRRFFFDKQRYSDEELQQLAAVGSDDRHVALGAAIADEAGHEIEPVAVARCLRSESDPAVAEVAFTTVDAWQQHGIGTVLLGALAERAWEAGIRQWRACSPRTTSPRRTCWSASAPSCWRVSAPALSRRSATCVRRPPCRHRRRAQR
jgi:GNAT superfamily N-acetyltransferase